MELHDLSADGDVLERVTRCAQQALAAYGCHPATTVRLLNVSENATYLVEDPAAGPSVLRVHRHGKEPCPRCGTPIAIIFYEDRETYYCPVCQAGGKVYADRRRSRLLR